MKLVWILKENRTLYPGKGTVCYKQSSKTWELRGNTLELSIVYRQLERIESQTPKDTGLTFGNELYNTLYI